MRSKKLSKRNKTRNKTRNIKRTQKRTKRINKTKKTRQIKRTKKRKTSKNKKIKRKYKKKSYEKLQYGGMETAKKVGKSCFPCLFREDEERYQVQDVNFPATAVSAPPPAAFQYDPMTDEIFATLLEYIKNVGSSFNEMNSLVKNHAIFSKLIWPRIYIDGVLLILFGGKNIDDIEELRKGISVILGIMKDKEAQIKRIHKGPIVDETGESLKSRINSIRDELLERKRKSAEELAVATRLLASADESEAAQLKEELHTKKKETLAAIAKENFEGIIQLQEILLQMNLESDATGEAGSLSFDLEDLYESFILIDSSLYMLAEIAVISGEHLTPEKAVVYPIVKFKENGFISDFFEKHSWNSKDNSKQLMYPIFLYGLLINEIVRRLMLWKKLFPIDTGNEMQEGDTEKEKKEMSIQIRDMLFAFEGLLENYLKFKFVFEIKYDDSQKTFPGSSVSGGAGASPMDRVHFVSVSP